MTESKFSQQYHIKYETLDKLLEEGVLCAQTVQRGKTKRILIDSNEINKLEEGKHYVVCPSCGQKLLELSYAHFSSCSKKYPNQIFTYKASTIFKGVKTEKQKRAQSLKLKQRFQTSEGEITRKQISEASRNVSPEVRAKKIAVLFQVSQDPVRREQIRQESLERWRDPEFRKKIKEFQQSHKKEILKSAARARTFKVYKKSGLHEMFKKAMIENGLLDFESEKKVGFYSIDEANEQLKLAVEVDGCYWHGCKMCGYQGIRGTQNTDKRKEGYLRSHGWKLLRIPEHDIKSNLQNCLLRVRARVEECKHEQA